MLDLPGVTLRKTGKSCREGFQGKKKTLTGDDDDDDDDDS